MPTTEDFLAEGVIFRPVEGQLVVSCPRVFHAAIQREVKSRQDRMVAMMGASNAPVALVKGPLPRWGACAVCGEPMPAHRGGDCALCTLARRGVLRERSVLPPLVSP